MSRQPATPAKNGAGNKPAFFLRYYDRESQKIHTITCVISDISKFSGIYHNSDDEEFIRKLLNTPSETLGVESVFLSEDNPPARYVMVRRVSDLAIEKSLRAWFDEDGTGEVRYQTKEEILKALNIEEFTSARICPVCGYDFRAPTFAGALDDYIPINCPMCHTVITPVS